MATTGSTVLSGQDHDADAVGFATLRSQDILTVRSAIRCGSYASHTAGLGANLLQANVVILPADHALDFFRYCQRNPKPCPLVGVSDTGDPMMRTLGGDIDIRSDVPRYNVYRDGVLESSPTDISDLWQNDFVAFALGCSFTFEEAMMAEGIPLPHIEQDKTVSMYRTNIETQAAGPFSGPMVVSMRPLSTADAIRAAAITARFPHAHGAPVHMGDPAEIGIDDISAPHWGDPVAIEDGQVPVFWACGVTPQAALTAAKPALCITHAPGRMLITDIPSWATEGSR